MALMMVVKRAEMKAVWLVRKMAGMTVENLAVQLVG